MEKEKIQLQLDLEHAKKSLKDAQDEVNTMGGNIPMSISFVNSSPFVFQPSDSTQTDVCSENRQLQARLKNVISLDTMKQALEKDTDLAGGAEGGA